MVLTKSLPVRFTGLFVILLLFLASCDHSDDELPITSNNINDFIWKGLNSWYYWQEDVNLLNDTLASSPSYIELVTSNNNSQDFFYSLLNDYPNIDRFSWIVSDYNQLINLFQGTYNSLGFELGLAKISPSSDEIFGYVKYVYPNSTAEQQGLHRGDFFTSVNGITLNVNNYIDLIYGNSSFQIELSDYDNGEFVPTGETKTVTQQTITENPVYYKNVYTSDNHRVGYLVYNSFTYTYNEALNEAFAYFQSENITDLILDLRYNSGGSVETAAYLASMIKGANGNQVFADLQFNSKHEDSNENYKFSNLMTLYSPSGDEIGQTAVNSVNINSITVLTTYNTASASELIINGLKPFIPLTQIGTVTRGKNVGSITLYDSPIYDFRSRANANPGHHWAMQPIVFKTFNSEGQSNYEHGFVPNIELNELQHLDQFFDFGNPNETLLQAALATYGIGRVSNEAPDTRFNRMKNLSVEARFNPMKDQMYIVPN